MFDVSSSERNYNDIQMKIYAFNQILEGKKKTGMTTTKKAIEIWL